MDELINVAGTTEPKLIASLNEPLSQPQATKDPHADGINSPEQALIALREHPDPRTLRHILYYLGTTRSSPGDFDIRIPGPLSAQMLSILLNDTLPHYWDAWHSTPTSGNDKALLIECLKSVGGLGAIVACLKSLVRDFHQQQEQQRVTKVTSFEQRIRLLLDILTHILQDSLVQDLWRDINEYSNGSTQKQLLWREFVSLIATGKIISVTAQVTDLLKSNSSAILEPWYASGAKFAGWLGRSIALLADCGTSASANSVDCSQDAALLLGKSFTLGYSDQIIWGFLTQYPIRTSEKVSSIRLILERLRAHEQRQYLFSLLGLLSKEILNEAPNKDIYHQGTSKGISSSVALLQAFIDRSDGMKESLVSWLTNPTSGSASVSFSTRRVALAALQLDEERMCRVLERTMEQFGDELFIKHTPMLQQEAITQILLMSCGYIHRMQPMLLFTLARSSAHMKGTSNRLGNSSLRSRFLGMIAATSISELIDKPENRLTFDFSDADSAEANWYRNLTQVNDSPGSIADFEQPVTESNVMHLRDPGHEPNSKRKGKDSSSDRAKAPPVGKIIEVVDDADYDDLVPYAKPDSDPEDDSEDPTQVTRNKPIAPVYIRDLLAGLRDAENYDRHQLALSTAASLIRRKTDFGKEVRDNLEELAAVLAGLKDQFDLENFQEMHQQALIAVVMAEPTRMGPYLVRCFYNGDYSFSQRVAILTAIGLSAREMAGFETGTDGLKKSPASQHEYPTKTLPGNLHMVYSTDSSTVDAITDKLKRTMISPMALDAADKMTGPNALKVRTFSSRMQVEKKRKVITNKLAKIVARSFFFPLTGGWWSYVKALGGSNIYYYPMVLPVFLKTLAILLHASGASTLSLPQMTSEFWDLLLSVRNSALNDSAILEGVLFAFLTLLEVNEDQQRLVQEHSRELLETQEWVKMVFDRTGGGSSEEERVRTLAAGVLVRCSEVVEKHQRLLMGDMMDI